MTVANLSARGSVPGSSEPAVRLHCFDLVRVCVAICLPKKGGSDPGKERVNFCLIAHTKALVVEVHSTYGRVGVLDAELKLASSGYAL